MAEARRPSDQVDRLVTATGRRLYITTLGLVALLIVGIGVATAVAGLRSLDADVDRALTATVDAALARLDGELPSVNEQPETDEPPSGASDTFVLDLRPDGTVVANPSRVALTGLPVADALTVAESVGRDARTVDLGGLPVRLMTARIGSAQDPVGFVQAGFVLTLHDREGRSLVLTVALAGLAGLAGAAFVTLLVTRRALTPIRRAFDAQRRFVADASHELRTPTAIIRATAEVLEREGAVAPEGRPLLADIVAESDRLGRLVGDLLALATTSGGALAVARAPVDLDDVATTAARRAERLAADRAVRIDVRKSSAGPFTVDGDLDRLIQLALILLDNAIDHAPDGTPVELDVTRDGSAIRLSVSDSGPGIPPADRERVFEPFARLDRADRRASGNAGLGLAIGRRIAGAHGGSVVATERPGGGARFVVTLPASRGKPALPAAGEAPRR
jgi:signal transduction histidine kinase